MRVKRREREKLKGKRKRLTVGERRGIECAKRIFEDEDEERRK